MNDSGSIETGVPVLTPDHLTPDQTEVPVTPVQDIPPQNPTEKPHSPSILQRIQGLFGGNKEKALVDPNSSAVVSQPINHNGDKTLDINGTPMHPTYE